MENIANGVGDTVYPENPPKDFNEWINYIYSLLRKKDTQAA